MCFSSSPGDIKTHPGVGVGALVLPASENILVNA